jgi:SPP1 gp7 family putative phage head morphogenesis protein
MARPLTELEKLQRESASALASSLSASVVETMKSGEPGESLRTLERRIARMSAVADLLGRRRLLLEVSKAEGKRLFSERDVDFLPDVPFSEAVDAIIGRRPTLALGWRKAQEAWSKGAFALAKAAHQNAVEHVQKAIAQATSRGISASTVRAEIVEALGGRQYDRPVASYMLSYADTVFRTTTTSAYAQGRLEQAKDPEIAPFIGAWRYDATSDPDVRPNHKAADGFVAAIDDPVWNTLTPPLGYNCRCALSVVPRREAKRLGVVSDRGSVYRLAPAGAGPDAGFRNAASTSVYG